MIIRTALESDLESVLMVERAAFGSAEIPDLVRDLLSDPSAKPFLSLLAFQNKQPMGHLLFTRARLESPVTTTIFLLAPLAVIPEAQSQGIGTRLMVHGLEVLSKSGTDLVFVLGHPTY